MRPLFGKISERTNRLPNEAEVVAPTEIVRIEAEAPRNVGTVRIRRRGPVVPEGTGAVKAGNIAIAGSGKEDAL